MKNFWVPNLLAASVVGDVPGVDDISFILRNLLETSEGLRGTCRSEFQGWRVAK
jgi:hypothetical protein